MTIWPKWKEDKVYASIIFLLLVSAVVYLGAKTDNLIRQSKEVGRPQPYEHTILVEGEGRVTGKPDIATVTLGTESHGVDVAIAQASNSDVMNKIIAELKAMSISEDDIQTSNYNVGEDTKWNPDTNTYDSNGWVVYNYVTVKVRDTAKLPDVLAMAGQNGITNISGPIFTIDDSTNLKNEARVKAIAAAQKKAKEIAQTLGLQVESVVGYSEWEPSTGYNNYYDYASSALSVAPAPTIESGSSEVTVSVSITYKLVN